jgi:hypothetical protein
MKLVGLAIVIDHFDGSPLAEQIINLLDLVEPAALA